MEWIDGWILFDWNVYDRVTEEINWCKIKEV